MWNQIPDHPIPTSEVCVTSVQIPIPISKAWDQLPDSCSYQQVWDQSRLLSLPARYGYQTPDSRSWSAKSGNQPRFLFLLPKSGTQIQIQCLYQINEVWDQQAKLQFHVFLGRDKWLIEDVGAKTELGHKWKCGRKPSTHSLFLFVSGRGVRLRRGLTAVGYCGRRN